MVLLKHLLSLIIAGHTHNDIYYTKNQLEATGASAFIGDNDTYTSVDPIGGNLKATLNAIDILISGSGKLATGNYVGDGNNNRSITVGFVPKFIGIFRPTGITSAIAFKTNTMANKETVVIYNAIESIDSLNIIAIVNQPQGNENLAAYNWIALG
jgi:hypothetical protein